MGIPTVNGAVYFDERYLGNPLVYCGNVGLIPRDKSHKETQPGDLIVADRRPHRPRRHPRRDVLQRRAHQPRAKRSPAAPCRSATRSKRRRCSTCCSRPATAACFTRSPIAAPAGSARRRRRDGREDRRRGPSRAGAAQVRRACRTPRSGSPKPRSGWSLAVPRGQVAGACTQLCESEGVEATAIGRFVPTGRLQLKYNGNAVGDLAMEFLHEGRPPVVRQGRVCTPARAARSRLAETTLAAQRDFTRRRC